MKKLLAIAALVAASFTVPAAAEAREARVYGKPTTIAFAANGGIRDWHADSDRSLYLRDRGGRWYHAILSGPCPSLRSSQTILFETDLMGRFDTFSTIRTRLASCGVQSIVTSPAPAAKGGPRG